MKTNGEDEAMKVLSLDGSGIVIGKGALTYLNQIKCRKAFIVTGGKSMLKYGVIDNVTTYLKSGGGEVSVYSGIGKNPTTQEIMKGVGKIREEKPDLVVAVGGGSAIDAAKMMTLFYEFPELTFENILSSSLPQKREKTGFIAIPSTSGTGTEVTHVAVYTDTEKDIKIPLKTLALKPDIAILDGDLPMTMPRNIAAETGMDALTHAIEAYTNPGLDDFSEVIARGAVEGIMNWLLESCDTGSYESREKMHYYQSMAGIAFANVGLGMVHGISHAIGAIYNLAHGITNAIILPYVMDYNLRDPEVKRKLDRLSKYIGCENMITEIKTLKQKMGIPHSFFEMGLEEAKFLSDFDEIVDHSMTGATTLNPVAMTRDEMKKVVKAVYYGTEL
jgi:alcohol dehydrogenase class IV